jgi:hypothetical protein
VGVADKTWKAAERRIAAILGTTRIPPAVFGQRADRGDDAPDCETDRLAVQIKHGYSFPAYLRDWLAGITRNAGQKTGVVVWHRKGQPFTDAVVLVRLADFAALVAQLPAGTHPSPPR